MLSEVVQKEVILESLNKSQTYDEYRAMVKTLAAEKGTTGADKSEALVNYTALNDRRMKRWDKTVKVSDEIKSKTEAYEGRATWLVLTESWCGDAAHIMPVINKVAQLNSNIDFKVVLRDENDELMNAFLTNGGKSIPKLIMIDSDTHDVIADFGPRPQKATQLVEDYKAEHGKLTPEFKEDLQLWYNKDKGQSTLEDLMQLL
ncbi:MAG: thioredoxin family protein [Bacteroidetes bacterium MedPE-SWsnd-G2]|nr:MAG: thioredoxin family protein [Bacteroidetes bacterium MedPE-SWsnd-G2]